MPQLLNKILETATDSTLTAMKTQQTLLEKKLNDQETINIDLYQKILKSALITQNIKSTEALSTPGTTLSISPLVKQIYNGDFLGRSDLISSMLPFNDMIRGINIVFETFFDPKFWIYTFCGIALGFCFMCFSYLGFNFLCRQFCCCFFKKKKKDIDTKTLDKSKCIKY